MREAVDAKAGEHEWGVGIRHLEAARIHPHDASAAAEQQAPIGQSRVRAKPGRTDLHPVGGPEFIETVCRRVVNEGLRPDSPTVVLVQVRPEGPADDAVPDTDALEPKSALRIDALEPMQAGDRRIDPQLPALVAQEAEHQRETEGIVRGDLGGPQYVLGRRDPVQPGASAHPPAAVAVRCHGEDFLFQWAARLVAQRNEGIAAACHPQQPALRAEPEAAIGRLKEEQRPPRPSAPLAGRLACRAETPHAAGAGHPDLP